MEGGEVIWFDVGILFGFWECGGWFGGGWLAGMSVKIVLRPNLVVCGDFFIDFISSSAADAGDGISRGYKSGRRLIWGTSLEWLLFSNRRVKNGCVGVLQIPT